MVRVTDIKPGYLNLESTLKVDESTFIDFSQKRLPRRGDIAFSRVGSYGVSSLVNSDEPFCLGQNTTFIVAKENPFFLYYFLNTPNAKSQIDGLVAGSTQPTISLQSIKEIVVPYPHRSEQDSIASILSSLDDKIDLLHHQNKTLEALAETLFRQWFVEEAEEGWETGTIEDEFDFTMGQSPSGSSFNEEGIGMVFFQGRMDFGFRFPEPRVYTAEPNRLARKFDTLVSVRAPVGDMNMAVEECCLGRGVAAFRYKDNPSYHTYTYYKLRSLMAQIKQFEDSGTVFGSVGKDDFKKLENIIPPDNRVIKFESEASGFDEKIYKNTLQIKTLTRLRDKLLPKLMSGEVRVKLPLTPSLTKEGEREIRG